MRNHFSTTLALLTTVAAIGCSWDEGLVIENMVGTVVIPSELVTRTYANGERVADVRGIGPVYLGLYSGAVGANVIASYPHPSTGPVFDLTREVGDAYPYGGTTIGMFRSICLEDLQCRVSTGRFQDYDQLLEWFEDYLDSPVTDWYGEPVESGEELRNICLTAFDMARDDELGLISDTPDFRVREDGHFEAEFTIFQQQWYTDTAEEQGYTLWGYVDMPSPGSGLFGSCEANSDFGERVNEYNQFFDGGAMVRDVLNRPSQAIEPGDIVSGVQEESGEVGFVYRSVFDIPELWLNTQVQQ